MIDVQAPDYTNTPASDSRPRFHYQPDDYAIPFVSIITPYYNTGPIFQETVLSIQRSSFSHWEWLVVDDGSTNPQSLAQLDRLAEEEPRVRIIHQTHAGPAVARNRAAREARGRYLLQLDSDDLIEPTFVEKALWVLETQPQFAACNSCTVTFGAKNYLWPHGFEEYHRCFYENWVTNQAVIRRDAYFQAGGYDERCIYSYEDWDFWLNLAEAGHWGFTLPEYLTWYRLQEHSRMDRAQKDPVHDRAFLAWLHQKHRGLVRRFPHPRWGPSLDLPRALVVDEIPLSNPLMKPERVTRVLLVVPWLIIGGAEKFNLDLITLLSQRGYEFTIAATLRADDAWLHRFSALTPDIFRLHQFLHYSDYPRFLNYLIDSRQIDAVLISNSEPGYSLTPYLRARHPNLAILDYTHSEVENWKNGGYPGMSVRLGQQLDLRLTNTNHLRDWMTARGAPPESIHVCHYGIDPEQWSKERYDSTAARKRLRIPPEAPLLLFVGRLSPEKRPLLFARIIERVAAQEPGVVSLVVGTGPEAKSVRKFVKKHRLGRSIRLLGALSTEQVREVMAAGDILLLPSEIEGLALVLFECMAMETVPVAANIGGHAELVTPACGLLIPPGDGELDAYVEAVLHLLRNPQKRSLMAKQARQRIVEGFDLSNLSNKLHEAISRGRELACARSGPLTDPEVVRQATSAAIEDLRLEEADHMLWAKRGHASIWSSLRRLRQTLLPLGSGRYEVYKQFRQALRRAKGRFLSHRGA